MSVINQMLKDLDKRQAEQNTMAKTGQPVVTKHSNVKLILSIIVVIVIINITGIFAWQLYSENQQLKTQAKENTAQLSKLETQSKDNDTSNVEQKSNGEVVVEAIASTFETKPVAEKLEAQFSEIQQAALKEELVISTSTPSQAKEELEPISLDLAKDLSTQNSATQSTASTENIEPKKVIPETDQPTKVDTPQPRLSISRTQLSPQALAKKKISQAEQAMEVNELAKAESLFEEVLLLLPEHETARKQLAALWYGKKAYQDAINLLSQGIALAPQAEEMRLMSARIYFEQGQARQALNMLTPVSNSQRVELLALLANIAAQLNEHQKAGDAYRKLLDIESSVGRWWLGLAVSLDSQGQFKQASNAYSQAIVTGNLSNSTMQFARQRLSELGE